MTAASERIKEAVDLLKQNQPTAQAIERLEGIGEGHPNFGAAQALRGRCALRDGDLIGAKALLMEGIRLGDRQVASVVDLARTAALSGMPADALAQIFEVLRPASGEQLRSLLPSFLQALDFAGEMRPQKDAVFERFFLPLMASALEQRKMDVALDIEHLLSNHYAKAVETEAHFGRYMERIAPLFTEAGHHWRASLPPARQPALAPPYRVGFFIHNASTLAHIGIMLTMLRGYRTLDEQPFEPVVYCLQGNSPEMERALADAGVRLVMLSRRFPGDVRSNWKQLLNLRDLLAEEGVQELVWISVVVMMPLAFSLRLAPVQVWWCMKYHNFSHPDIDGYVCTRQSNGFGMLAGRVWRMAMLGSDDWFDPGRTQRAAEIRASINARVVLISLGRTEKMRDPVFVNTVVELLQAHPDAAYVWAGHEQSPSIVAAFKAGGVLDRTHYVGWVDTLVFAQVGDVFIDTFPFPCGITLVQAMAAGKPVVLYDSPEAAQTGVWNVIKPRLEGTEGTPEECSALRSLVGDRETPKIAIARTPQEYIRYVSRLIDDAAARAAASEASLRFVEQYYSDIRGMAASMSRHFVELIEERRASD